MKKNKQPMQFHLDPLTCIVTKDRRHWVSMAEAKARYDTHHNEGDNPTYIQYQKRIFDEFIGMYIVGSKVMDFGSGEGEVLKQFIPNLVCYDLYYHPDQTVLNTTYDSIILIEVVEHFEQPLLEFKQLVERLNPGGRLIIQTQFYDTFEAIASWWYVRDATHVSFYCEDSFRWLCEEFNLNLIYVDGQSRVVLEKSII